MTDVATQKLKSSESQGAMPFNLPGNEMEKPPLCTKNATFCMQILAMSPSETGANCMRGCAGASSVV